jgi:Sec-independent protein translocase protein TatA
MNIFGMGEWELLLIVLIMLVVAGPKRMIQWAYVLGKYTAQLQVMFKNTMQALQKEVNAAGVDVQLPDQLPTSREQFRKQITQIAKPLTQPLEQGAQQAMGEMRAAANDVRNAANAVSSDVRNATNAINTTNGKASDTGTAPTDAQGGTGGGFGAWSQGRKNP